MKRSKPYRSRLARRESQRIVRQSVVLIVLTGAILFGLYKFGIPMLVGVAGFFENLRTADQPIDLGDKIAPSVPRIAIGYSATASARIDVTGYTEPAARVSVYNSGDLVEELVADEQGMFKVLELELTNGENEIYAKARDNAGNESNLSGPVKVVLDQSDPEIVLDGIDFGQQVRSDEKIFEYSGSTEKGASLYSNDQYVRVDSEGKFSARVTLQEGDNEIRVRAVDEAGNVTSESFVVIFYE